MGKRKRPERALLGGEGTSLPVPHVPVGQESFSGAGTTVGALGLQGQKLPSWG